MYNPPVYLRPTENLKNVAMRLFNYHGDKFKVQVNDTVNCLSNWFEGSRDYFKVVSISGGYVETVPQNGTVFDRVATPEVTITPDIMVVEHSIFCGKDMGITFHVHSSALPKLLPPASETEVTRNELIVLIATRSYKSSYGGVSNYRFVEAHRKTGITLADWDIAKADCIDKGYLNKSGAITVEGKNIAGNKQLYSLKGGD